MSQSNGHARLTKLLTIAGSRAYPAKAEEVAAARGLIDGELLRGGRIKDAHRIGFRGHAAAAEGTTPAGKPWVQLFPLIPRIAWRKPVQERFVQSGFLVQFLDHVFVLGTPVVLVEE